MKKYKCKMCDYITTYEEVYEFGNACPLCKESNAFIELKLHKLDVLDIIKTPNGEIAIIDEISRGISDNPESVDEASITYITHNGKDYKSAWWDVSELTFIKNLSELLKEMIK